MKRDPTARPRRGHLFIIGGAEDREKDKVVLSRLYELAGGPDARIVVLTAASSYHDEVWGVYDAAFCALGSRHCEAMGSYARNSSTK